MRWVWTVAMIVAAGGEAPEVKVGESFCGRARGGHTQPKVQPSFQLRVEARS